MTRICYQEKVNAGAPQACTVEKFNELLDSPVVKKICEQIANLDATAPDYEEKKGALKRRLPVLIPHACAFVNENENANENWSGKRKSELAVPSGLVMLDVDHVADPHAWFSAVDKQVLSNEHVYLVAVTPSGKGLRIIGERLPEESIETAMARLAKSLGIDTYDAVTKDLARASYMMPREYVLWIYEAWLCEWPSEELKTWWTNGGACNAPAKDEAKPAMEMPGTVTAAGTDDASINEGAQGASEASGIPPERSEGVITQGEAAAEGLCFKGIPYSEIVEQLMTSIGANGGAVQGERNTVYFSLANYMRYICDFDASLLLQVLPDFGLAVEERKQAIHSALGRPRKMTVPTVVQAAVALCEKCTMDNARTTMGKATDMPMPALPKLLQIICRKLPAEYRPAMVIASLPVLGTLATRIRFEYLDRQVQSLSFFSCITAPAASGKSFIRKPIDLLLTPINEQDQVEREKEQAYKEALRASKNSKNQPQDPRACPRNNGVAISIAKLLQLLTYSEGKHLIGIGEEMDTLVKSERAGVWSQKSDIYRLAFDNAEYGQAYMSDASFSAHIAVYYNLLMTGTPNSMKRFFKDLENGLATRVCFAQLPDTSFSEIPVFAPYSDTEREEIIRWARVLDTEQGMVSCPQVGKVIGDWLEAKRQQAIDADSHAADTLRRRSAVIGFRAGMLCWLLEGHKWTKTVGEFAEWVAEYVFRNQMELWGEQMEQELTSNLEVTSSERGAASSLLGLLDKEFTTGDLIKLRAKKGQSVSSTSVNSLLCRWKKMGRIDKTGEGKWRRLN